MIFWQLQAEVGREQANFTSLRGSLGLPPFERELTNWLSYDERTQLQATWLAYVRVRTRKQAT